MSDLITDLQQLRASIKANQKTTEDLQLQLDKLVTGLEKSADFGPFLDPPEMPLTLSGNKNEWEPGSNRDDIVKQMICMGTQLYKNPQDLFLSCSQDVKDSIQVQLDKLWDLKYMVINGYCTNDSQATLHAFVQTTCQRHVSKNGLAINYLEVKRLKSGETSMLDVAGKVAWFATQDGTTVASQHRQRYCYPLEFDNQGRISLDERSASADEFFRLLAGSISQMTEGVDSLFLQMLRIATDKMELEVSPNQIFSNMQGAAQKLRDQGVKPECAILPLRHLQAAVQSQLWEPPATPGHFLQGDFGKLYGLQLRGSPKVHPDDDELFLLGVPTRLGAITLRREVTAQIHSSYAEGRPTVGWYVSRVLGMAVVEEDAIVRLKVKKS